MPKPALGQKHECSECGARFYDLGREEAICPKCGTVSVLPIGAIPEKRRRRRNEPVEVLKKEAEPKTVEIDEEDEDEESDVEELDLDDAQAERHLNEAIAGDDDGEDADTELNEVGEFSEEGLPEEVEVVGSESVSDDDGLDDDDEDTDD